MYEDGRARPPSLVSDSNPAVMSQMRFFFANAFVKGSIFYHGLPVCKTCEWMAGECVGGNARFSLSTCGSECAETIESLAADEGYSMRAPLEAVVQCNGGWAASGSSTLHADLAAYVANAWVTCNPDSTASSDAYIDHICQLGSVCTGNAICGKASRFLEKLELACPKQCDTEGKHGLPVCDGLQPERSPSTCKRLFFGGFSGLKPRFSSSSTKPMPQFCVSVRELWIS
jgi:hypothetical protein